MATALNWTHRDRRWRPRHMRLEAETCTRHDGTPLHVALTLWDVDSGEHLRLVVSLEEWTTLVQTMSARVASMACGCAWPHDTTSLPRMTLRTAPPTRRRAA